ncbi:Zn-ribbon domain-containing OB-fold protein [Nonomuraea africana]|uniref:Zn-ribbon domain-containing OB-fold protein n=1 Tax=Nonomuraea africana TaxID=46171 RepID=UPI0033EC1203
MIPGWFDGTHLIGTRCTTCQAVFFPPHQGFCRDPRCEGEELVPQRLSRRGTVWSYTNACYPPPAPFVAAEPYEPVTLAAVELARERIVVLGQVKDLAVEDLRVGMELELTEGTLADGPRVWMWGLPR